MRYPFGLEVSHVLGFGKDSVKYLLVHSLLWLLNLQNIQDVNIIFECILDAAGQPRLSLMLS